MTPHDSFKEMAKELILQSQDTYYYICGDCGEQFRLPPYKMGSYCPFCGTGNICSIWDKDYPWEEYSHDSQQRGE